MAVPASLGRFLSCPVHADPFMSSSRHTDSTAWLKRPFRDRGIRGAMSVVGWRRIEVIVLLAAVLGLDGADKSTIGAIATSLESALDIGNTQIGLLVSASTGIGALAALPMGTLVDRANRKHVWSTAIVVWSVAMIVSAFAHSFVWLLISRLGLGAVVATAFPAVASLAGDMFPSFERGRIWGYLLSGELLGTAVGFLVAGMLSGLVDWRAPFWLLGLGGARARGCHCLAPARAAP